MGFKSSFLTSEWKQEGHLGYCLAIMATTNKMSGMERNGQV